jgi:predicted DNA-binding transcriptional regulator AlpA
MREIDGLVYLNTKEVAKEYGWAKGTLYYFRELGLLDSYKFIGEKSVYWRKSDLDAIKTRPPEVTKRGPKPLALATAKSDRAKGRTVIVGGRTPAVTTV